MNPKQEPPRRKDGDKTPEKSEPKSKPESPRHNGDEVAEVAAELLTWISNKPKKK